MHELRAPARPHYNFTLAVLVIGGVAYSLVQSLVVPALPEFEKQLHASTSSVSWLFTAYLLSASVATPILGRLGDMYGKEHVLVWTLVGLAAGSILCALSTSLVPMIVGRLIQGAGGGIFPLAFGIIRDEFPRAKVAGGIGFMSSLLGVGGGLGLVLAGPIMDNLDYHWLYWIPLIPTAFAALATWRWVPESPVKTPGRINWIGAALMSAGLIIILVVITQTTDWGWGSARTLGGLTLGLAILAVWIVQELSVDEPLVDMRIMRIHAVWTTNLAALLVGVGMYASFEVIPQYVQEPASTGYGFGASLIGSGLFLLPCTVLMVTVGQFSGAFTRRFGSKQLLVAGCAASAAAFVLLLAARSEPWQVYLAAGLLGIGTAFAFASLGNLIVEAVDQHHTGVASGMNTVMRTLGGAFGAQVCATFLSGDLVGGHPSNHAFGLSFLTCTIAVGGAVVAALLVPSRSRDEELIALTDPAHEPELEAA
ncbi:MAG TPA: MFS transporter [Solirubrobacteraceae bacterium]|jgi:EmrB/QacA subfamily drug resistance transporter|nr:MFS transporter [Solirubrobacteraceae bacterium]